ncbi:NfeD family protein [Planococcus sp. CAU13]|uniref:NfeD family protein n=1 Tax=Planococcus sp. CAU13 TaxID=1541197 RepID=UPI00052FFAEF|nr:NfeD family protein [Planococcus sp. CAU13]
MELFGLEIGQVYMYGLLITGALTLLYVLFADMADAGDGLPFLNPAVLLAFFTLFFAIAFLLERATGLDSATVIAIAAVAAVVLDILFYIFVLLPLKSAEASIAYTEESLLGQVARVIVPIPADGYGEVVLETYAGMISKRATGYNNEPIAQDEQVLIIEIADGTLFVREYEPFVIGNKK